MKMPDTVLRSKATLTTPCPSRASTTRSDARRTGILFMDYSITIIENDAHRVSEAEIVVSCTMYEGILGIVSAPPSHGLKNRPSAKSRGTPKSLL